MPINKDKNVLITIQVSKEEKEKIKQLAEGQNRTIANFVSTIIKEYLKDK